MNRIIEQCECRNCHKSTPFTDEGGHCEVELGWLCNDCIKELQAQGIELHFQDEEI